jgi:DNA adenine methylase
MAKFHTPLRYPGGKAKLSWLAKALFRTNGLCDGHYAEPYAGGAGIGIELLLAGYVSHIHLNDLNYPVYCFWRTLKQEPDRLCEHIHKAKLDIRTWNRNRTIIDSPRSHTVFDVAFAFFYLNRTNRSGIINAGIIGGYDQSGPWKMDARFPKAELADRIERIGFYKDCISITNMDAAKFLLRCAKNLPNKSLIYLDPPYFVQGQRLYDNFYNPEDHADIAQVVKKLNLPWFASYDDVPQIRILYQEFRQSAHELCYSAAKAYKGKEALIFSDTLILPPEIIVQKQLAA